MSYDELLSIQQNMDQLRTFTVRDKMMELRDLNGRGKKINRRKTGNINITSYIATFEVQRKANGNKRASTEKQALKRQMCVFEGVFTRLYTTIFITTIATLTPSEEWLFVKKLSALLLLTT